MFSSETTGTRKKISGAKAKTAQSKNKKGSSKKFVKKGDPVELILAKMAELHQLNWTEVKEEILLATTGYARSDSKGYRKATKQLIKELEYVTRSTTNKVTTYVLTEKGREFLVESGAIVVAPRPTSNNELHAQLKDMLTKIVKAPLPKLEIVFETLLDGHWHPIKDILAASGYERTDSKGYRSIMSGLKKLELVEKEGSKLRFTDKAFAFGRP